MTTEKMMELMENPEIKEVMGAMMMNYFQK